MTLQGTWRAWPDKDWEATQPGKHIVAPKQSLRAIGDSQARHIWHGDLSFATEMACELGTGHRLAFSIPAGTSANSDGGSDHIAHRITTTGELHFGRTGPRHPGSGICAYKRDRRIRWRDTRWRLNGNGLWLIDPGPMEEKPMLKRFPAFLIDFLGQLKENPRQAITENWHLSGQCPLCGKNVGREKIHYGCSQHLPTSA